MKRMSKRIVSMVCALMVLIGAVPFTASVSAATTTLFYEGFEGSSELPAGWTAYDVDGDGYNWHVNSYGYNGYPDTGNCLESYSATSGLSYMTPNEYVTLPPVAIPSSVESTYEFSFQIYTSYMPGYADYIRVYVSTAPIDPATLTNDQIVLDEKYYSGNEYEKMAVNLDAYRGETIYIAFHHHTASGVWQQLIDDVMVTAKEADRFDVDFVKYDDAVTVTPLDGQYNVIDGQDYSFKVDVASAFHPENGTLTVTANGKAVQAVNGVYTLKNVTDDQEVVVDFAYAAGDVNGDGHVSITDAMQLFYGVNGMIGVNPLAQAAGNIDTYETFDVRDVTALYHYIAGSRSYIKENRDVKLLWNATYADTLNGFTSSSSCRKATYYLDRREVDDFSATVGTRDGKAIFYTSNKARVVNMSDGYAFTLPFKEFTADYSLSALRSRYESDTFVLNVSKESGNPYGNSANGWNTYLTEWLERYLVNDSFLSRNEIKRTHVTTTNTKLIDGYTVKMYGVRIDNAGDVDMPHYTIAVVRKNTEYVKFHLFVLKSTTDQFDTLSTIVKSFKELTAQGVSKNEQTPYECEPDKNWNAETKAYYEKLLTQNTTDWGFFTESMSDTSSTSRENLTKEYAEMTSKLDYEYEIMPTYTHIGWGSTLHHFPSQMAADFAGGNGFNGKPVLQFTYQFTTSNNGNLDSYTPMFDIMRGEYDDHFRRLARDIKRYGAPVLFRLNNEMNTDWTSYCGIVNLLDPDIFTITWERLYRIFEEEGVDNCIWIFNPFAKSTPYCSWGEDLCYLPDLDTVHVLGLTAYEMGNEYALTSFQKLYSDLYKKNSPHFTNYPQIISEFGAGAGGEKKYDWGKGAYVDTTLGRNAGKQTAWVKAMFDCLSKRDQAGYEFCQGIKGAVWFSVNDYVSVDGVNYISNYFALDDNVSATLEAFKAGLALHP